MSNFELPLFYSNKKFNIEKNVLDDLELSSDDNSTYKHILNPNHKYSNLNIKKWCTHVSYDKKYLKDTQILLKNHIHNNLPKPLESWSVIKSETAFKEKYNYFDWKYLEPLNHSKTVLGLLSILHIASPLMSLIFPIIGMILPYFMLKFTGAKVSFSMYWKLIVMGLKNHFIGKLFFNFFSLPLHEKISVLFSLVMYVLQVYQNIKSCIRFFKNIKYIHNVLEEYRIYISETIDKMNYMESQCNGLNSYKQFIDNMNIHKHCLYETLMYLQKIRPFSYNLKETFEWGNMMEIFYKLYFNNDIENAINYSFNFIGYIDNLNGLKQNINAKHIGRATYAKKSLTIKDGYYANHKDIDHINNTFTLKKNMIITGPNASGKTTILKSTLLNVIFSQQFGYGFYKSANIPLYQSLSSYLNIPDTSNRDSLFQAEARRCKDILAKFENKSGKHFCIFDELYSGTNPYEAIASAFAFINYLTKNIPNLDFMVTTHYIDLCEKLQTHNNKVCNMRMKTQENNDDSFNYLYELENGISEIKGGIIVLKDLDYPKEIIENTKKILNNIRLK